MVGSLLITGAGNKHERRLTTRDWKFSRWTSDSILVSGPSPRNPYNKCMVFRDFDRISNTKFIRRSSIEVASFQISKMAAGMWPRVRHSVCPVASICGEDWGGANSCFRPSFSPSFTLPSSSRPLPSPLLRNRAP